MDITKIAKGCTTLIKKYRYVLIILLIGLILMIIPTSRSQEIPTATQTNIDEDKVEDMLSAILSKVNGAGEVQVLLTTQEGEQTIYQTNEENSTKDTATDNREDAVIVTDAQRNQSGLIRQINPPIYRGAIVVCEGADDPSVRYAVIDAVSKITGLGTNRISVLKMK